MSFSAKAWGFWFVSALTFCHVLIYCDAKSSAQEKTATVLFIHMFTESFEVAPHLQLYTMIERIENAFQEQEIKATIIPITTNKWEKNPKKRQAYLVREVNKLIARSRKLKITHIVLAGHGNSDKNSLTIGDFDLDSNNIRDFYEDFELLRDFLAPKIKIFLFGCSTFKHSKEKELHIKANWLRKIFETKEVEIFGFEYPVYSDISGYFWLGDLKSALIAYGSALFAGSLKMAADKGMRFITDGDWKFCTGLLLAGTPIIATTHWAFDHYLRDTTLITWLRQLFFYGNLGTVITFEGSRKKHSKRILGYDYFRNEFVQA